MPSPPPPCKPGRWRDRSNKPPGGTKEPVANGDLMPASGDGKNGRRKVGQEGWLFHTCI